jgi:hypothetical protein
MEGLNARLKRRPALDGQETLDRTELHPLRWIQRYHHLQDIFAIERAQRADVPERQPRTMEILRDNGIRREDAEYISLGEAT